MESESRPILSDITFSLRIPCASCGDSHLIVIEDEMPTAEVMGTRNYYCGDCQEALEQDVEAIVVFEETRIVLTQKYGQVAPLVLERDEDGDEGRAR